jgi:hypothetical protein
MSISGVAARLLGVGSYYREHRRRVQREFATTILNNTNRRHAMNRFSSCPKQVGGNDLQQVIEPLASYICATERPKAALLSALEMLFREVEGTNQVALSHYQTHLHN